jgi:hypothetical protein
MSSGKFSAKAWNSMAARVVVVIVMAAQLFGAAWLEEPVQPRIEEEFTK